MQFKDNPTFTEAFNSNGILLYMPANITDYHKSREVAMQVQEKYAHAGITKELIIEICNDAIDRCNKQMSRDTLRSDMSVIFNNLLARTQSPVDELCAIRMGAIACFMEGEDPARVDYAWTEKKVKLAMDNPDVYAFFLSTGIAFTPEYNSLLRTLSIEDYLSNRKEMLSKFQLPPLTR